MKRYFLLLAISLIPLFVMSQFGGVGSFLPKGYETLDTTAFRVFYEFNYPPALKTVKRLASESVEDSLKQEKSADYMVLELGTTGISKFYSDYKRMLDSMIMDVLNNVTQQKIAQFQETLQNSNVKKYDEREIFKNYPEGKMTVTDQAAINSFTYTEELNEIQWQITSDTLTCLNYLCQKATCDFRGRRYEAWFAPEIPVNDGPWKFSGLPGLILYVKDSTEKYVIKAVGIEYANVPLKFAQKDYIKTNRKEVDKIKKRYAEDPLGYTMSSFPGVQIPESVPDGKGGMVSREDLKMIYNPMELE
ncbi:MAG: GLPGLI family protein [Dysgonamonadaceae bacterium]|nr:GLPGLI family protein [Dysgonamonadaceae bacterium]